MAIRRDRGGARQAGAYFCFGGGDRRERENDRQLEDALAAGRERMIDATTGKLKQYGCAGKAGVRA